MLFQEYFFESEHIFYYIHPRILPISQDNESVVRVVELFGFAHDIPEAMMTHEYISIDFDTPVRVTHACDQVHTRAVLAAA